MAHGLIYDLTLKSVYVVASDLNKNFGGSTYLAKKGRRSGNLHTPFHLLQTEKDKSLIESMWMRNWVRLSASAMLAGNKLFLGANEEALLCLYHRRNSFVTLFENLHSCLELP